MDGAYFYYFSWMAWIISTFFMKKNQLRLKSSVLLLLLIIFTAHYITINTFSINIGYLILITYGYFEISHKPLLKLLYFYITCLTITLGYVSFNLFEMIDPVWLFLDQRWLLSLGLVYFVIVLQKNIKDRIICLILSTCHGELVYSLIIRKMSIHTNLGSFVFFDILSISFFMLICWWSLEYISLYFSVSQAQRNAKQKLKQG